MTKTISKPILISSLLIGIFVLASNIPAAEALRVNYRGDSGTLTLEQQQDVLDFLLTIHAPELAAQIMEQVVTVEPRTGDTGSRITIRESQPGDALFCLVGAVQTGDIVGATITTVRGDGSFSGGPTDVGIFDWGTVVMFHGTQSTNEKLTLDLKLEYKPLA